MRRLLFALILTVIAMAPAAASDKRSYGARSVADSKGTVSEARSVGSHSRSTSAKCATCDRDANGRIKRDPAVRRTFQQQHPCPATGKTTGACPGYVVDHVLPLKRGGADALENMQWQTTAAARAKDRIE
jgi:5-methylcytosine-specific restriction endonuclease McrA